jgi:hypothetical protein
MPSIFTGDKSFFSSNSMFHRDYDRKGSVEKIIAVGDSQGS